jgi:hypothetical protein
MRTHNSTSPIREEEDAVAEAAAAAVAVVVEDGAVLEAALVVSLAAVSAVLLAAAALAAAVRSWLLPQQPRPRLLRTRPCWQDSRHSAPRNNNHESLFPKFTFHNL